MFYLVNGLTLFVILLPLLFTLWGCKDIAISRRWQFWIGSGFLVFSALSLAFLSDGLFRFENAQVVNVEEENLKADVVAAFGVWVIILPAIYLGIGINLITHFLRKD